ncbi:rhomboid-related protein 2-like [Euwallacea fornicatus]|uniref:rhomboid-related protein 2-like n=1 Tax=Euwallacea fornicatus TaxID=995702 RepID=UPI00338D7421
MRAINEKKLHRYQKIFAKCDTDQDNFISIRELKAFLKTKGNLEDLTKDQIIYIFKTASKDGTKKLDFDEFVEFLENPDLKFLFGRCVTKYINFLVPKREPEPPPIPQVVPKSRSFRISYKTEKRYGQVIIPDGSLRRLSVESAQASLLISEEAEDVTYIEQFTCCPPPICMILISLLQLVFFVTDEIIQEGSTLNGTGVMALIFIYDPQKRFQAWRYLTYMFVHIGYLHIVVNLIVQLMLGIPLEMVHGWWRVSFLYFAGVIAGSLATSVTDPWVRLAGASGGVYCLLTAHIATIIMNWKEMIYPFVQLLLLCIVVICDLGSSINDRYSLNVKNQVGCVAHLGGAVAGLLVGIYILKNLKVKNFERYLWWAAVVTFAVLILICILLNILLPERYPVKV